MEAGWTNVAVMSDGLKGWSEAHRPVEPVPGG